MKKIIFLVFAFIMAFFAIQPIFALGDPIDGGGMCCPSLYVYDGSAFQFSGTLGLESSESIQLYTLNVTPVAVDGLYRMYLEETSISYIDQIKLIVDDIALPICHGDNLLKHSDDDFLTIDLSSIVYIAFPAVRGNSFAIQIEGYVD